MYVDNFIYFLARPEVEKKFKNDLKLLLNVEFTGPPQYFFGLKINVRSTRTI